MAVELLPEVDWEAPSDLILEDDQNNDPNNITDLLEQEERILRSDKSKGNYSADFRKHFSGTTRFEFHETLFICKKA